jgi:hypothetical protein
MELDIANTDVGEVRLNLCCIYAWHLLTS